MSELVVLVVFYYVTDILPCQEELGNTVLNESTQSHCLNGLENIGLGSQRRMAWPHSNRTTFFFGHAVQHAGS